MGVDIVGTTVNNEAEAKSALDHLAAQPPRADKLHECLPNIMRRQDLRYAVKDRHITAMLSSAASENRTTLKPAVLATLPYAKFWNAITADHMETVGDVLLVTENVKTLADIANTIKSDTRLNRIVAPIVTKMARRIKAFTDDKKRKEAYAMLALAVRGSSVLEDALRDADQPERSGGPTVTGPNKSITRFGTRQP